MDPEARRGQCFKQPMFCKLVFFEVSKSELGEL